jgi:hypothetical protein
MKHWRGTKLERLRGAEGQREIERAEGGNLHRGSVTVCDRPSIVRRGGLLNFSSSRIVTRL